MNIRAIRQDREETLKTYEVVRVTKAFIKVRDQNDEEIRFRREDGVEVHGGHRPYRILHHELCLIKHLANGGRFS